MYNDNLQIKSDIATEIFLIEVDDLGSGKRPGKSFLFVDSVRADSNDTAATGQDLSVGSFCPGMDGICHPLITFPFSYASG